jgi:hypothetical protein
MMGLEGFRRSMRRKGKKNHVIDGLVHSIERFRGFLLESNTDLASVTEAQLDEFAEALEKERKGLARKVIRGVALYYDYVDQPDLARYANRIRERAISKTRRVFKLADFKGVNTEYVESLAAIGIVDVQQLIQAGKTPSDRKLLAQKTGIPYDVIVEYVKLSDLTRIGGLRTVRARLYYDAGLDTINKIAESDPTHLREHFVNYVESTGFPGIPPLPKELSNAVITAQQLEEIVEYEDD